MNATQSKPSLKGSKFYGEFYTAANFDGFLYRLASGEFVVVQKAEYSGKILSIGDPIRGNLIERHNVLNLGYSCVNQYRLKVSNA